MYVENRVKGLTILAALGEDPCAYEWNEDAKTSFDKPSARIADEHSPQENRKRSGQAGVAGRREPGKMENRRCARIAREQRARLFARRPLVPNPELPAEKFVVAVARIPKPSRKRKVGRKERFALLRSLALDYLTRRPEPHPVCELGKVARHWKPAIGPGDLASVVQSLAEAGLVRKDGKTVQIAERTL